jgi:hypothetical protein
MCCEPLANARRIDCQYCLQRRIAISQRLPRLIGSKIWHQRVLGRRRLIQKSQDFDALTRTEQIEHVRL